MLYQEKSGNPGVKHKIRVVANNNFGSACRLSQAQKSSG
jgi:hypothetical protein